MHENDAAVIVVGGGHAGVEAALAAARLGAETLLLTGDAERICTLPCNPSIGGSAKGQLVREIDALGGAMGTIADRSTLHSRFLNESKGPAVRALRAQADKPAYARNARAALAGQPNLTVGDGALVEDLIVEAGAVRGVVRGDGSRFFAPAVVLATGTFLGGRIVRGEETEAAGRFGEPPAIGLSAALGRLGFPLRRLKTGTPPRVDRTTVDWSRMQEQAPSAVPLPFSYRSAPVFAGPQLPCAITQTTAETHALVRANLHRSPLYGLDLIRGIGPRYCPSIEDKVVKFAHNPSHQIFIEPEGWDEPTLYVGGFSTSLPADVQLAMLRTLPGLEAVEMLRAGYAVEYDAVPPIELTHDLQTRRIAGLFHCGQLNGTSGYEEAAAQGLIAGINAARRTQGKAPVVLGRDQAYIGVLIDDLVTKDVDEPYRMLTSRAEHRVVLRHDNADDRLTPLGFEIGSVDEATFSAYRERRAAIDRTIARLDRERIAPQQIGTEQIGAGSTFADVARRPTLDWTAIRVRLPDPPVDTVLERAVIETKLAGYIRRSQAEIAKAARTEGVPVPADFAYETIPALSREAREKLARHQPATLGAAARVPGVGPADVAILAVYLHKARETRRAG